LQFSKLICHSSQDDYLKFLQASFNVRFCNMCDYGGVPLFFWDFVRRAVVTELY